MRFLWNTMNLLTVKAQKTPVVPGYLSSPLGVQVTQGKTRTENTEIPSLVTLH